MSAAYFGGVRLRRWGFGEGHERIEVSVRGLRRSNDLNWRKITIDENETRHRVSVKVFNRGPGELVSW